MQMGGGLFYRRLLSQYHVRFISWRESKDPTDPAHCKKCAVDFAQMYAMESTRQREMCRDLTPLCTVNKDWTDELGHW